MKLTVFFTAILIFIQTSIAFSQSQKLPANEDFFIDFAPEGFAHKYEQQNFNQVLIEFLPKDETLENWTQMLSLTGTAIANKVPDLAKYTEVFFSSYTDVCKQLDIVPVKQEQDEIILNVSCLTKDGSNIPGGEGLKWENGVYRFVKTNKMIYQVHFVTHGSEIPTDDRNTLYMQQAKNAVENVLICKLNDVDPCPPLDQYTSAEGLPLPVSKLPPCQSDGYSCNPSAMIEVAASNDIKVDETQKTAFMVLDFSKVDVQDPNVLRNYLGSIATALKQGVPGVLLVLRGDNPNSLITNEDRVKVGSFISYVRMFLVSQNLINPDKTKIIFHNFKS